MHLPRDPHANRREFRALRRLAWPVVLSQVSLMMMGVVDTIMLGHFGSTELAAVAAANILAHGILTVVPMGVLAGLDPVVSQAFGAGRMEAIGRAYRRGMVLAVLMSLPLMASFIFIDDLMVLAGQPPELIVPIGSYVMWLIPGMMPGLLFMALRNVMQGAGVVRPIVVVVIVANVFNALANWIFIYGAPQLNLDLPVMGVAGAGIATSMSRFIMFGGLLWMAHRSGLMARIMPKAPWKLWEWGPFRTMFRVGIPVGIQHGLEVGAFGMFTLMAGWLGTVALAGHQIALNLAALAYMVAVGVSAAASVRVGQAIGRRDPDGARRAAWISMLFGGAIMSLSMVVFALIPGPLAAVFTNDPAVWAMAASLIPLGALFQLVDGVQAVGFGVLRGTGDTRIPTLFGLFGYYFVALPLSFVLAFRAGMGVSGIWIAIIVGLGLVSVLVTLRVRVRLRQALEPLEHDDEDELEPAPEVARTTHTTKRHLPPAPAALPHLSESPSGGR